MTEVSGVGATDPAYAPFSSEAPDRARASSAPSPSSPSAALLAAAWTRLTSLASQGYSVAPATNVTPAQGASYFISTAQARTWGSFAPIDAYSPDATVYFGYYPLPTVSEPALLQPPFANPARTTLHFADFQSGDTRRLPRYICPGTNYADFKSPATDDISESNGIIAYTTNSGQKVAVSQLYTPDLYRFLQGRIAYVQKQKVRAFAKAVDGSSTNPATGRLPGQQQPALASELGSLPITDGGRTYSDLFDYVVNQLEAKYCQQFFQANSIGEIPGLPNDPDKRPGYLRVLNTSSASSADLQKYQFLQILLLKRTLNASTTVTDPNIAQAHAPSFLQPLLGAGSNVAVLQSLQANPALLDAKLLESLQSSALAGDAAEKRANGVLKLMTTAQLQQQLQDSAAFFGEEDSAGRSRCEAYLKGPPERSAQDRSAFVALIGDKLNYLQDLVNAAKNSEPASGIDSQTLQAAEQLLHEQQAQLSNYAVIESVTSALSTPAPDTGSNAQALEKKRLETVSKVLSAGAKIASGSRFWPAIAAIYSDARISFSMQSGITSIVDAMKDVSPFGPDFESKLNAAVTAQFKSATDRNRCMKFIKQVNEKGLWGTLGGMVSLIRGVTAAMTVSDPKPEDILSIVNSFLNAASVPNHYVKTFLSCWPQSSDIARLKLGQDSWTLRKNVNTINVPWSSIYLAIDAAQGEDAATRARQKLNRLAQPAATADEFSSAIEGMLRDGQTDAARVAVLQAAKTGSQDKQRAAIRAYRAVLASADPDAMLFISDAEADRVMRKLSAGPAIGSSLTAADVLRVGGAGSFSNLLGTDFSAYDTRRWLVENFLQGDATTARQFFSQSDFRTSLDLTTQRQILESYARRFTDYSSPATPSAINADGPLNIPSFLAALNAGGDADSALKARGLLPATSAQLYARAVAAPGDAGLRHAYIAALAGEVNSNPNDAQTRRNFETAVNTYRQTLGWARIDTPSWQQVWSSLSTTAKVTGLLTAVTDATAGATELAATITSIVRAYSNETAPERAADLAQQWAQWAPDLLKSSMQMTLGVAEFANLFGRWSRATQFLVPALGVVSAASGLISIGLSGASIALAQSNYFERKGNPGFFDSANANIGHLQAAANMLGLNDAVSSARPPAPPPPAPPAAPAPAPSTAGLLRGGGLASLPSPLGLPALQSMGEAELKQLSSAQLMWCKSADLQQLTPWKIAILFPKLSSSQKGSLRPRDLTCLPPEEVVDAIDTLTETQIVSLRWDQLDQLRGPKFYQTLSRLSAAQLSQLLEQIKPTETGASPSDTLLRAQLLGLDLATRLREGRESDLALCFDKLPAWAIGLLPQNSSVLYHLTTDQINSLSRAQFDAIHGQLTELASIVASTFRQPAGSSMFSNGPARRNLLAFMNRADQVGVALPDWIRLDALALAIANNDDAVPSRPMPATNNLGVPTPPELALLPLSQASWNSATLNLHDGSYSYTGQATGQAAAGNTVVHAGNAGVRIPGHIYDIMFIGSTTLRTTNDSALHIELCDGRVIDLHGVPAGFFFITTDDGYIQLTNGQFARMGLGSFSQRNGIRQWP
jgi:hypothetical protein